MQEIMKKANYDVWYDKWVTNFTLNLNDIWDGLSARTLTPENEIHTRNKSAIVIGRGPSLTKFKHLEILANSKYEGAVVCCDSILINALKAGVTPDKFPNFYVTTIDAGDDMAACYDDEIVNKFGEKINAIFTTVVSPLVVQRAKKARMKIHWLHALFDYNEGKKSFNQISASMVRTKTHSHGLPAIQTGGNAGTSSWFICWKILKCSTVVLIGIDHGWNETDSWDKIISHGYGLSNVKIDMNSPSFKELFPKIYNPEFDCYCILDPIFIYYSGALKEFISRSPSWLTTINATEGGSIFGERIKCMSFSDFIDNPEK
jgi:hypothetical protein